MHGTLLKFETLCMNKEWFDQCFYLQKKKKMSY